VFSITPVDLAARAVLQGKVLSTAGAVSEGPPPLKSGVKIVFVAAPDTELAEYLRAERAATVVWWLSIQVSRFRSHGRCKAVPHRIADNASRDEPSIV
jgi:hypothetical protein